MDMNVANGSQVIKVEQIINCSSNLKNSNKDHVPIRIIPKGNIVKHLNLSFKACILIKY